MGPSPARCLPITSPVASLGPISHPIGGVLPCTLHAPGLLGDVARDEEAGGQPWFTPWKHRPPRCSVAPFGCP